MKATVVEIHKNYCFVITRDGRFLKKKIPAGSFEIGDEIIIKEGAEEEAVKRIRVFQIASRAAIGFAAIVAVVFAAYFGIRYAGIDNSATELAMAPGQAVEETRSAVLEESAVLEKEAGSEDVMASEETVAFAKPEEEQEASLALQDELFSGTFTLEKMDTDVMLENNVMFISYRVDEVEEDIEILDENELKELTLKFMNIKENTLFEGNADIMLMHSDKTISEIEKMVFEDLNYNQQNKKVIPFKDETDFRLIIFGIFK